MGAGWIRRFVRRSHHPDRCRRLIDRADLHRDHRGQIHRGAAPEPGAQADVRPVRFASDPRTHPGPSGEGGARRRTARPDHPVLRHPGIHVDLRSQRAGRSGGDAQRIPHPDGGNPAGARWDSRQVHRRRGHGILERPGCRSEPSRPCSALRDRDDRRNRAPSSSMGRRGKGLPADRDRDQHR